MIGDIIRGVVAPVVKGITDLISESITDKDKANELIHKVQVMALTMDKAEMQGAVSIILAEANGQSWLQRNWRPILMLTIVAIIANNYIIAPYLALLGAPAIVLELPGELYTLMTIGVGGYIAGRSGEKIARTLKRGKD